MQNIKKSRKQQLGLPVKASHCVTLGTAHPALTHLPGEMIEDVTALGVQDGDGLSKMVSLQTENKNS